MSPTAPSGLRERTRRAIQAEITATALRLFSERGFDRTTIEQIAANAGISRRSFFRYFDTKEDIVLGDLAALGLRVRDALEARPAGEGAWEALRAAFTALRTPGQTDEAVLATSRIYADAPSLRARHLEKHRTWQKLLAPDIQRRLGLPDRDPPDPRAIALVASALACLDTAVDEWTRLDGHADLEQLFDEAVAAVRR